MPSLAAADLKALLSRLRKAADLTFTWSSNLLVKINDASGRGDTLIYSGSLLTQIKDFAARTTSTGITSGLLRKVTDPDGGFDSLFYNANNLLTQLNSLPSWLLSVGGPSRIIQKLIWNVAREPSIDERGLECRGMTI